MSALQSKTIGEIAKVKGGKRLPKGMDVQDDETAHPYLRIVDFGVDGIDRRNIKFISNETFDCVSRYIISSDDIYVSIAGTIGRVGIIPDDLSGANLTENAAKLTEIRKDVDKHYLLYFLRSSAGNGALQNKAGGTSQPKLALFRIEEVEFPCPSLQVQQSIARILTAYDDLIENNRRRMALLEDSTWLLYNEWFVRLRFPGYEHTHIVDGVPEGWKKVKVGSLLAKISKIRKIQRNDYLESGPIPCIDQGANFIGGFTDDEEAQITNPLPLIVFGDHTRVLKFVSFPFASGADGTQLISPNTPRVSPEYFYFALKAIDLSNYFYARHFKFLKEESVTIPAESLVREFSKFAANNFEQINNLRTQNQKLRAARDLLLPRLMNGEITV